MCFHAKGLKDSLSCWFTHIYLHPPLCRQWRLEGRCETATPHMSCLHHGVRITPKCVSSTPALLTATVFTAYLKVTVSQHLLGLFICALKKDLDTCHSLSLQEHSQPGRTETSQTTPSGQYGMLGTPGRDRRCGEKWGKLPRNGAAYTASCRGWGKGDCSRQR